MRWGGKSMKPIVQEEVQELLNAYCNQTVYLHLETTNGAYANHIDEKSYNVGAFIRNAKVTFTNANIIGNENVYRAGLKTEIGWVYAEGLSDYEVTENNQLLLAGHDREGRLMVALQLSKEPFEHE
jgi:hypothetical protein